MWTSGKGAKIWNYITRTSSGLFCNVYSLISGLAEEGSRGSGHPLFAIFATPSSSVFFLILASSLTPLPRWSRLDPPPPNTRLVMLLSFINTYKEAGNDFCCWKTCAQVDLFLYSYVNKKEVLSNSLNSIVHYLLVSSEKTSLCSEIIKWYNQVKTITTVIYPPKWRWWLPEIISLRSYIQF